MIIFLKLKLWKYDTEIGLMGNMYYRGRLREWRTGRRVA
jgi:hypothetical protein